MDILGNGKNGLPQELCSFTDSQHSLGCLLWGTRYTGHSTVQCLLFSPYFSTQVEVFSAHNGSGRAHWHNPHFRRPHSQLENEVASKCEHNCPIKIFPMIKCTWKVSGCWPLLWESTILDNFLGWYLPNVSLGSVFPPLFVSEWVFEESYLNKWHSYRVGIYETGNWCSNSNCG